MAPAPPATLHSVIDRTRRIPIDSVQQHPRNPNNGDVDEIAESLRDTGLYRPIVIQKSTGFILAGNHTWAAAASLGWTHIDATIVDVDDHTANKILAKDNRLARLARMDEGLELELLHEITAAEVGGLDELAGTGYDAQFLSDLEKATATPYTPDSPDHAPEPPAEADTISRLGDMWRLVDTRTWSPLLGGPVEHLVLCGDCTHPGAVAPLLDGVELFLTDPPYCSGGFQESDKAGGSVGTSAAHKQIANDRLSTRGYQALMRAALGVAPFVPFAYVFTDWRMWVNLFDVLEASGFGVRSMIVWNKSTPGMGRGWRSQHELIAWATKATPPFDKHAPGWGNVIDADRTGNDLHTTQKPVDLLAKLIKVATFDTNPAAAVYDPFAGSGSTLIAAQAAGRPCRLVELDPAYVDVILRRWQQAGGDPPIHAATGQVVDFLDPDARHPDDQAPPKPSRQPARRRKAVTADA